MKPQESSSKSEVAVQASKRVSSSCLQTRFIKLAALVCFIPLHHLLVAALPTEQQQRLKNANNDQTNLIEADENGIYLLGLFDIHQSLPRSPFKCGPIETETGERQSRRPMQNMEAFLWAIDQVNADQSLLPGIKLGSLILDTCSSFLKTNQQLANLLHAPAQSISGQPNARQFAAIVADNADWQSVEAVASMASSLGLTTFVSQSRSTKLAELAQKYKPTNQLDLSPSIRMSLSNLGSSQPDQLPLARTVGGSNFRAQADGNKLPLQPQLDGLLGELLGIGRMATSPVALSSYERLEQVANSGKSDNGSRSNNLSSNSSLLEAAFEQHSERLYMVRMLLGNEILAEAIASLVQQMNWDLISIVYDDEPDLVDLHDELVRQLFIRNTQLAMDEQLVSTGNIDSKTYERLLQSLGKKTTIGSRVVISLLNTGNSRALLNSLRQLRTSPKFPISQEELAQVNSLLWITIADREPYYSFATDALGTVAVSSSVSLLPEFKSHYDKLTLTAGANGNKWWPDYVRTILNKHKAEGLELLNNECNKWQEPKVSPLVERCQSLSLSSIAQLDQKPAQFVVSGNSSRVKLSKYLAGGWEHNGMDVINSVLATANGLESIRRALCPGIATGLCDQMRELISPRLTPQEENKKENPETTTSGELPMLSELLYNELLRSTFQLADGRMFNLDDFNSLGGQLEGKLKVYNLRYLQPNSIGFVKFGNFDQQEGLTMNVSKARYYPSASFQDQVALETVKSSCEDESKCLMLSGSTGGMANKQTISEEELALGVNNLFKLDHPLLTSTSFTPASSSQSESTGKSRKETLLSDARIQTMRSLQLMHRFNSSLSSIAATGGGFEGSGKELSLVRTYNMIVLLPLHKSIAYDQSSQAAVASVAGGEEKCSNRLDAEHSFQRILALAYAQNLANNLLTTVEPTTQRINGAANSIGEQQIELTTTVIDYCEQVELAKGKLAAKLASNSESFNVGVGKTVAVIDFDSRVGESIHKLANEHSLLHLSIASGSLSDSTKKGLNPLDSTGGHESHLRLSVLPTKTSEIQALVKLVSTIANWRLVHLIYTDKHHYRDEFVRLANEANICVSKLIWIPPLMSTSGSSQVVPSQSEHSVRLEKTRTIFAKELYDYNSNSSFNSLADNETNEGLNATKVIVLLASSDEETNRMILEASSESMLDDYIWITSHEWLSSVEMPAELSTLERNFRLPRLLLSSRLETFESNEFRRFYTQLSPAVHTPLPTSWFDEFWQQHFQCRLPIANSKVTSQLQSAPLCTSSQHLDLHNFIQDDLVHYTIQTVESLYAALLAYNSTLDGELTMQMIATNFKRAYEQSTRLQSTNHANRFVQLPYGYNIVHRLLSKQDDVSNYSKSRRQNSRELSHTRGRLTKVGLWRDNELILLRKISNETNKHLLWLNSPSSESSLDPDLGDEISMSLNKLGSIKSRCVIRQTCNLCRRQVEQTQALIRDEEARMLQSSSFAEPKAISSIRGQRSKSSILDVVLKPTFDEELATEENLSQEIEKVSNGKQLNDIDTSASSFFDVATSKQIERQHQTDIRRAYSHMMHSRMVGSMPPMTLNLRQTSGMLMSTFSLFGIICIVISMTHLYPNMLDREEKLIRAMATGQTKIGDHSTVARINDYFLLTGLLMLYSINVAFLLPATMGVCWFRRIGLATSYTTILSSVLVKVLTNCCQSARLRQQQKQKLVGSSTQSTFTQPNQIDPLEENVEVTFESLPPEKSNGTPNMGPQQHQTSNNHLSNSYQTAATSTSANHQLNKQQNNYKSCTPARLLAVSLSLIIGQVVVSLIWLIRQPPEPTLFESCWHCSSPNRTRLQFLYGPLLNLTYAAIILLICWIWSIKAYKLAHANMESFREITCQLLLSGRQYNVNWQMSPEQQVLKSKLRDAKSLVMATTLLVLIWSLATLHLISIGRRLNVGPQQQVPNNHQELIKADDLTLVYVNILSGAIIFAFLFVYRHSLLSLRCCWPFRTRTKSRGLISSAASEVGSVLKFNQEGVDDKWLPEYSFNNSDDLMYANGSQFISTRSRTHQERFGLQQFNTYGTYSAAMLDQGESYHTSTTINPLSLQALASSLRSSSRCLNFKNKFNQISKLSGERSCTSEANLCSLNSQDQVESGGKYQKSSLFFGSSSSCGSKKPVPKPRSGKVATSQNIKIQRRQSAGSVASSTAKLFGGNSLDTDETFMDDTISCASSVASSSTSQLHGNELYPIDCSIQLDSQLPNLDGLNRSVSFSRRSLRRSINKLSSVRE